MPKVTVIIPTYRRPKFLHRAIASVLSQTFEDFELLIIDDNSEDITAEVVKKNSDARIRYYCNTNNKGGAASRNRGIREAQAAYIAFLDDDDEWLPEILQLQVSLLDQRSPDVGGVYTGYEKIKESTGESLGVTLPTKKGDLSYELLLSNPLAGTSGLLFRKHCFDVVGVFDEALSSFQDYDLWIRISKYFQFEYINQVLYRYYVHDKKIWTNPQALSDGLDIITNKHCTEALAVRKHFSSQFLTVGVMFCYSGNLKKGRKAYWKAIKLYPFEIRNYFNLVLSLMGKDNFNKIKTLKQKLLL